MTPMKLFVALLDKLATFRNKLWVTDPISWHKYVVEREATIDDEAIVATSARVEKPTAVRYGWENSPKLNLYNKEGLPAELFNSKEK